MSSTTGNPFPLQKFTSSRFEIIMDRYSLLKFIDFLMGIVKLIAPRHISSVMINYNVVMNIVHNPISASGAAVVYHAIWEDVDGIAILMDGHQRALRHWIRHNFQVTELEWLEIMLGIATRLAYAHSRGMIHMDLKPSNS
jgi:Protein kinase domain